MKHQIEKKTATFLLKEKIKTKGNFKILTVSDERKQGKKNTLVSVDDENEFIATNYKNTNETRFHKYFVCVLDKETKQLEIIPTEVFTKELKQNDNNYVPSKVEETKKKDYKKTSDDYVIENEDFFLIEKTIEDFKTTAEHSLFLQEDKRPLIEKIHNNKILVGGKALKKLEKEEDLLENIFKDEKDLSPLIRKILEKTNKKAELGLLHCLNCLFSVFDKKTGKQSLLPVYGKNIPRRFIFVLKDIVYKDLKTRLVKGKEKSKLIITMCILALRLLSFKVLTTELASFFNIKEQAVISHLKIIGCHISKKQKTISLEEINQ